jgi:hypothetical protein
VVVVVVDDGGVGADNQSPPPHTPNGRLDDVATVVVGCPPIVRSPARPLPILCVVVFVVIVVFFIVAVVVENALPVVFPSSPPPPPLVPSSSAIVIPDRSLDSFPRNASANPSGSLDMFDHGSARRMPIARSAVLSLDDGHVRTSPPLASASSSSSSLSSSSSILLLLLLPLVVDVVVVVGPRSGIPRERAAPPSGAWTVPTRSTWGDD